MIRASALYIVIVITLVIAVICSSLIVAAFFYKEQYQRKFRFEQLTNNLQSGINVILTNDELAASKKVGLFEKDSQDSVLLKRITWGVYDIGIVRSYIQKDTLTRVFSMANKIDSLKWAALYLIDEDRPISVSGKTLIKGNAYVPKAGVKEAYVDNTAYLGNKKLVIGNQKNSAKALPALLQKRLSSIEYLFTLEQQSESTILKRDSFSNSFNSPLKFVNLKKQAFTISSKLNGNILIRSDTTITIDSSSRLDNVIVCAPSINVAEGFHGSCQLFATDSIHISKNSKFEYPSVIGVVQLKSANTKTPVKIIIDNGCRLNAIVFSYQKDKSEVLPIISVGEHTSITGQVYSQGIFNYKKNIEINGSVFTNRFIYQSSYTRFENYLIDVKLNSDKLSKYYLSSDLLPVASNKQRVLQWLK